MSDTAHQKAGLQALFALKYWDLVFVDNRPYKIVAKIVSGAPVDEYDRNWCLTRSSEIDEAVKLLGCGTSGALVAANYALSVVVMCLYDDIDLQAVNNAIARAENAVRRSKGIVDL